jgi:hypothetical protein
LPILIARHFSWNEAFPPSALASTPPPARPEHACARTLAQRIGLKRELLSKAAPK